MNRVITSNSLIDNKADYYQAAANLRTIAKMIGHMILTWKIWKRTTLVGFSLGGQMVGEAGKYVRQHGQLIDHCIGLDPAGPGFDDTPPDYRLSKDDCRLVQTLTSSAALVESHFMNVGLTMGGMKVKSGHCDFWINCGHIQRGCIVRIRSRRSFTYSINDCGRT